MTEAGVNRVVRYYLLGVVIAGLASAVYFLMFSDIVLLQLTDFQTYRTAAQFALAGRRFVATGPYYVYLPITVMVYVPLALLSTEMAYVLLFIANVAGALVAAREVLKICELHAIQLKRFDQALIVASVLLAPPLIGNLFNGQPNFWLLASLLAGYRLVETEEELM